MNPPADNRSRYPSAAANRKATVIRPALAWGLVVTAALLAAGPLLLALDKTADPMPFATVSAEALCNRTCHAEEAYCRDTAGRYQPALDRCQNDYAQCLDSCSPSEPSIPEPERTGRKQCIAQKCRPPMDSCQAVAANDEERSACEADLLRCMTACRIANPSALPQPATAINPRPTAVDPRLANLELATLNQGKQAVAAAASKLDPVERQITDLQAAAISVPDDLARAIRQAAIIADQAAVATDLGQLRALTSGGHLDRAWQLAEQYDSLLGTLTLLPTAYPTLLADLDREAAWLAELPLLDLPQWQQTVVTDFSRLLDTGCQSLAQAKGLISNGQQEAGLDRLNTGVLDNLREMQAMRQAYDWTRQDRATLEAAGLINRFRAQWPAGSTGGQGAALDLETTTGQLDKLTAAENSDEAPLTYFLAKELIDILELAGAAAREAADQTSTPLKEYLNAR